MDKKDSNKKKKPICFIKCVSLKEDTDKMNIGKRYRLLSTKNIEGNLRYLILDENNEKFSFTPSKWGVFELETC